MTGWKYYTYVFLYLRLCVYTCLASFEIVRHHRTVDVSMFCIPAGGDCPRNMRYPGERHSSWAPMTIFAFSRMRLIVSANPTSSGNNHVNGTHLQLVRDPVLDHFLAHVECDG